MPEPRRTSTGCEHISVPNWADFCEAVRSQPDSNTLFRGQREPDWKLSSKWERELCDDGISHLPNPGQRIEELFVEDGYEANRYQYLDCFKQCSREFVAEWSPKNDDEWWAIGRHFGLITPLLDWTFDPLVAVYFALFDWVKWVFDGTVQEELERRKTCTTVAIWRLRLDPDPFVAREFEFVRPDHVGPFTVRIQRQKGAFTRLIDGRHFDLESYLESRNLSGLLTCFDLPVKSARTAFEQLHSQGIHHGSLMPDPEGAAIYANWRKYTLPESLGDLIDHLP